jgi:hypothetical protein
MLDALFFASFFRGRIARIANCMCVGRYAQLSFQLPALESSWRSVGLIFMRLFAKFGLRLQRCRLVYECAPFII